MPYGPPVRERIAKGRCSLRHLPKVVKWVDLGWTILARPERADASEYHILLSCLWGCFRRDGVENA